MTGDTVHATLVMIEIKFSAPDCCIQLPSSSGSHFCCPDLNGFWNVYVYHPLAWLMVGCIECSRVIRIPIVRSNFAYSYLLGGL